MDTKGMTIDQAKKKIADMETEYSDLHTEMLSLESKALALKLQCFEKLQVLTSTQNQFYRSVIDIQNKQLTETKTQLDGMMKEKSLSKKSTRRNNLPTIKEEVSAALK